jgi:hypothetical protein
MSNGTEVRKANLYLLLGIGSNQPSVSCQIEGRGLDWQSRFTQIDVDRTGLDGKIKQLRSVLNAQQTAIWAGLTDPLAEPPPGLAAAEFNNAVERVVSEGAALYKELSAVGFGTILEKIESSLQEGDRLSIHSDSGFLPWEILYPFDYNKDWPLSKKQENPLRPKSLWGYKFITNHMLLPAMDEANGWEPPLAEHQGGPVFVYLSLDKTIEQAFQNRPFKPIDFHRKFYESSLRSKGELVDDPNKIKELLLAPDNKATIIYLYCHGRSDSPLAIDGNEELELDTATTITPSFLDKTKYQRGPIVILNSCSSAAVSPLSFSTFHKKFRQKRAMGIIGTTIQIPATFAAAFGKRLIEAYLEGVPIGKAVYLLRRELLDRNNPLGLFYSLQCPLYITAPGGTVGTTAGPNN